MPVDPVETERFVVEAMGAPMNPADIEALKAAYPDFLNQDPNELITFTYAKLLGMIFLIGAHMITSEDSCDSDDEEAIRDDAFAVIGYIQQKIKEYRQPMT